MKTRMITGFCFILFGISVFAQNWTVMSPATSNDIWGVSFINSTTGWISCSAGQIMKTTDGGASWTAQSTGLTTPILRDIRMFDQNTGWSVGDNGTILHTTNGGTSWTAQTSGVSGTLRHISFTSATNVWVCGASGTILHSTDGGATWTPQTSGTTIGLMGMRFVDAMNGWAVGSSGGVVQGIILHTSNGGTTWTSQSYPNGTNLNSCSFTDAMNGWAAGPSGMIYHTSDGGANWATQNSPLSNIYRAVDFTDATHGWLVDDLGDIVATSDGGTNWASQSSGSTHFFRTIKMLNNTSGFAAGNAGLFMVYTYNPPAMTLNSSNINAFSTNLGTPSVSQSFNVSGTYLGGSIQIDAPAQFEVSLSASSGFASSVQIAPVSGTVASTPVYVRYNPSAVGTHNGTVIVSSPGVSAQSFNVSGTCTTNTPVMGMSSNMSSFATIIGTPSSSQSFTVNGSFLTGNIQVDAPAEFEVSLSASSGFASSVQIAPVSGTVASTLVYVRYNPSAVGTHNGTVIISSPGVSAQSFQVDGSCMPLAVAEINAEVFALYPNPAKDVLTLKLAELSGNDELLIYSPEGKLVHNEKITQLENTISIAAFENGNYLLQLISGDDTRMKKLTVLH